MSNLVSQEVNKTEIIKWLDIAGKTSQLTASEKELFLNICAMNNLNPFKREVHIVKYRDKFDIITGYEVYIKRAEASGLLDGWNVKAYADGTYFSVNGKDIPEVIAEITIYRKDFKFPFNHTVMLSEYYRDTQIYKEKPYTMIKKVCISQGFRLCFPQYIGGMPYTQEEMRYNDNDEVMIIDQPANNSNNDNNNNNAEEDPYSIALLDEENDVFTLQDIIDIDHKLLFDFTSEMNKVYLAIALAAHDDKSIKVNLINSNSKLLRKLYSGKHLIFTDIKKIIGSDELDELKSKYNEYISTIQGDSL